MNSVFIIVQISQLSSWCLGALSELGFQKLKVGPDTQQGPCDRRASGCPAAHCHPPGKMQEQSFGDKRKESLFKSDTILE